MGVFKVPIAWPNEIIKSDDFNDGSDYEITNIVSALKAVLSSGNESFVIGGEVKPYDAGSGSGGLNVTVSPAFIYCGETGEGIIIEEKTDAISIISGAPKNGAYFTLGVKYGNEEYDTQSRTFNNPSVDAKELNNVTTKKRIIPEFKVWQGAAGSDIAPSVDEGYVKLAEIHISDGQDYITENDIRNITARKPGDENESWMSDKSATYNPTYLAELFGKFLVEHNEDGSHGNGVIKNHNIEFSTGVDGVNLAEIPLGENVTVKRESIGRQQYGATAISTLASHITDLYLYVDGVIKRFTLDSSLEIRAVSTENVSTNGIVEVDGETVTEGAIVLLVNQDDKSKNGLWEVSEESWSRAQGYTQGTSLSNHLFYSRYGNNAGRMFYVLDADDSIGTDEIEFGEASLSPFAIAGTWVIRDEKGRFKAAYPDEIDDVAIKQNVLELENADSDLRQEMYGIQDELQSNIDKEASTRESEDKKLQDQIDTINDSTLPTLEAKLESEMDTRESNVTDAYTKADEALKKEILSTGDDENSVLEARLKELISEVEAKIDALEAKHDADMDDIDIQFSDYNVKISTKEPDTIKAGDFWLCQ